jgi:hypothetical protein
MPAEIEIETREAQNEIHERVEHLHPSHWARYIPLSTALLAVLAAYAALESGSLVNEALLTQGKGVVAQAQASNQWAHYQAKGVKANIAQATSDILAATPGAAAAAAAHAREAARYKAEQATMQNKAQEYEKERDGLTIETTGLMHRHHAFAYCVTFSQIAIALSAIAALTRRRPMWYLSLLLGVVSVGFLVTGYLTH